MTKEQIKSNHMSLLKTILGIKQKPEWIYGTCRNGPARKHRKKGNVQFVLWKAGQQGHKEDCWHDFDRTWWECFTPNTLAIFFLLLVSCSTYRGIPNYKSTPRGMVVYRYSKPGEPIKDIMGNGDTVVSCEAGTYRIRTKVDTVWVLRDNSNKNTKQ